jgi:hypothetical protein
MKKLWTLFSSFLVTFSLAAQVPSNWDTNPPRDTDSVKYSVGISEPSATEQAAFKDAWNNALQNFASSIGTSFKGQSDITVRSEGYDSGIEDAYTFRVETASFSTQVQLTGMREVARKTERLSDGKYLARVLTAMSGADFQKAARSIENEEAAFLAYRFFAQKMPALAASGKKPQGAEAPFPYPDFYAWLRNSCVIISIAGDNQAGYLEQMDVFAKKLYRNAASFASAIDGQPSRIIYDSPRYYDGLLRALQGFALFAITREEARLVLAPNRTGGLAAFKAAVSGMKDASKVFVTGLEVIQTESGRANAGNLVVNQFKTLAGRQFGMNAVNFALPASFTSGSYLDEAGIVDHIARNGAGFPARYAAIVSVETRLEQGIPAYKLPPMVTASCHFTLYDVLTGETVQSGTADTSGWGVFSPSSLQDQSVLAESRRAIQFLYSEKCRPGLADIMAEVLGKL